MELPTAKEAGARALEKTDINDPILNEILEQIKKAIEESVVPVYRTELYFEKSVNTTPAFQALDALGYKVEKVPYTQTTNRYVFSW